MAHETKETLQSLLDISGHHLARGYRITRKDGTVYRITDHDSTISFPENWLLPLIDTVQKEFAVGMIYNKLGGTTDTVGKTFILKDVYNLTWTFYFTDDPARPSGHSGGTQITYVNVNTANGWTGELINEMIFAINSPDADDLKITARNFVVGTDAYPTGNTDETAGRYAVLTQDVSGTNGNRLITDTFAVADTSFNVFGFGTDGLQAGVNAVNGNIFQDNVEEYKPIDGFDAGNARTETAMKNNNIEIRGAFGGSFVTDADILAGLWDWAIVDDFVFDWKRPFLGAMRWSKYRLTDFQYNDDIWVAQAGTMTGELYRKSGKMYGDTCWHAFGDSHCGVNLNEAGVTEFRCKITDTDDALGKNRTVIFNDADGAGSYGGVQAKPKDYFKAGHLRWTSGKNNGQVYPIRSNNEAQIVEGARALGMMWCGGYYAFDGDWFTLTDAHSNTWKFIWNQHKDTGESAGTQEIYIDPNPMDNWASTPHGRRDLVTSAVNDHTDLDMRARPYDTSVDSFPTGSPSHEQGAYDGFVVLENWSSGTAGNVEIVLNYVSQSTWLNNDSVYGFGSDGLRAGTNDTYSGDSGIQLQYHTRADIADNDTFTLFAGCDKLFATCKSVTLGGGVNNKNRFGGFPFLIGNTKLAKTGGMQ